LPACFAAQQLAEHSALDLVTFTQHVVDVGGHGNESWNSLMLWFESHLIQLLWHSFGNSAGMASVGGGNHKNLRKGQHSLCPTRYPKSTKPRDKLKVDQYQNFKAATLLAAE
jgi:hypothetical protein